MKVFAALLCVLTIQAYPAYAARNPSARLAQGGEIVVLTNRTRAVPNPAKTSQFSQKERSPDLSIALVDQTQGPTQDGEALDLRTVTNTELATVLDRNTLPSTNVRPILLYVHGFNNSIEEAIHLAVHVANEMKFTGHLVIFSWPSLATATPRAYLDDARMADRSTSSLADGLSLLKSIASVDRVHVIAHSLGNRLFMRTISRAGADTFSRLGEVVLCSPDVEVNEFISLTPQVVKVARGVVFWASSRDRALRLAPKFEGGPRAGLIADGSPIVVDQMATIDVSAETGLFKFNHNAYIQVDELFQDLAAVVKPGGVKPWLDPDKAEHYKPAKNSAGRDFWKYHK